MRIYLASPVFSMAERQWNTNLAMEIEHSWLCSGTGSMDVFLPQEESPKGINCQKTFPKECYRRCIEGLSSADALVAILDGPSADDGTSFEVGYAVAKGIPVVGVRTDPRPGEWNGCNIMLSIGCTQLVVGCFKHEGALAQSICHSLASILMPKKKTKQKRGRS